jgi:hypothetical protein
VKKKHTEERSDYMEAIIEKVKELVREKFHDNISYFAKDVGLGREYVSSILNGRAGPDSPKFCNAVIAYCERNNLDYKEYISLK